jgi:hypothetical protein
MRICKAARIVNCRFSSPGEPESGAVGQEVVAGNATPNLGPDVAVNTEAAYPSADHQASHQASQEERQASFPTDHHLNP